MSDRDSPPPSWYAPPADGPESWPVKCPTCETQHTYEGYSFSCTHCGHHIDDVEAACQLDALRAERDYPAKEERDR